MKQMSRRNSKGFALAPILLVVALIAVVAGAIAIASRGSSTQPDTSKIKVNAAAVLQASNNLADGVSKMVAGGGVNSAAAITYDITPVTGLFHPTDGGASQQTVPGMLMNGAAAADFTYQTNVVTGVGTTAPDTLALVKDISAAACKEINKIVIGSSATEASITSALANTAAVIAAADFALSTGSGKPEGCIKTGSEYTFYKVLAAN